MKVEMKELDGYPVLQLDGRFDAHTVPQVKESIAAHITERPFMVVDLDGVTFIDSAALAVLVQGMKQCRERGGDLVLANLAQTVRIIFELTRLDQAFQIYNSLPQAAADLKVVASV